jgi:DMSO/TMAO reductase YedYZ molybdopterin-dependent catalytic subunit
VIPGPRARRDLWLVSVLGLALLAAVPLIAITGLLSNASYDPRLVGNALAQGRTLGPLDFYLFAWPTRPPWLYALTQGVHVSLGLAAFPLVLAKLWSVVPGLARRQARSTVALAFERLGLWLLVAGVLFESFTGFFEIEYFFPFHDQLIKAHYYGAWVLIAAFLLHAALKVPTAARSVRLRQELAHVHQELVQTPPPEDGPTAQRSLAADRGRQAISRRALLGTAAAGSLLLLIQGAAQAVGGPVRRLGLLLPRGNAPGPGPNDFEVNGTAEAAGLGPKEIGAGWRLRLRGRDGPGRTLSRDQLLALPQHSYVLPIACREGWSTTQRWTGVRLRDLAALAGEHAAPTLRMESLDGATAALAANQVADERSLLALRVNGADLSADHGYPARVIVPATIGVNCLKWVHALQFGPSPG